MATWNGEPSEFINNKELVSALMSEWPAVSGWDKEPEVPTSIQRENQKKIEEAKARIVNSYKTQEAKEESIDWTAHLCQLAGVPYERKAEVKSPTDADALFMTHAEALEYSKDESATLTSTDKDDNTYHVFQPSSPGAPADHYTITVTAGPSFDEECEEDEFEYISVAEFKTFIYDMVKEKQGALPDIEDWKRIKNMMDMLYDDSEWYDDDDEDDDDYYGSNESEILVGDADTGTELYFNGTAKLETTVNGVKINEPVAGDMYLDANNNMVMFYNGTAWNIQGETNE